MADAYLSALAAPGAQWDGHVLLLHATESERRAALAAWVQRGLDLGEKIVCTEAPTTPKDALPAVLEASGVDAGSALRDGLLEVLPLAQFFAPEGQRAVMDRALGEGFGSVRVSTEARAALTMLSPEDYQAFERRMDDLVRSGPFHAMCQYPQAETRGPWLDETVAVHLPGVREASLSTTGDTRGLVLAGEVDPTNTAVFAAVVATAVSEATRAARRVLWLDLDAVSYLDAHSCWVLDASTRRFRCAGGHVLLVAPRPGVQRTMQMLGLPELAGVDLVGGSHDDRVAC